MLCYVCPVQEQCLEYAIVNHEVHGIWAGKTSRDRATIRRQWESDGLLGQD